MEAGKKKARLRGTLDGGLSWFIALASFMSQFTVLGIHNVFGLLYIDLLKEFGESKATTAWVASIAFGLICMFAPLSSALCKKFNCKVVAIIGAFLCGLGLFLSSFVDSIFRMYVTYSFLFGLGSSMVYVSSVLILSNYFSKYLVVANGVGLSGAGVGTITLAPALSLLLDSFYWRDAVRILSATCLLLIISGVIYFLVPVPVELVEDDDHYETKKLIDFSVLKNKALILYIIVNGFVLFGFYIPYVHLVRHGQDLGIRKQDGAVLVGYMAMSQTFGKIVFGRIADHPRVNRVYLYQICLLVCSILTTLLSVFTSYDSLLAYCLIFGFHDGGFVVLIAVLTGDIAGRKNMASAYGIMYFFTGFAMMLGPPAAGWMYTWTKSYEPAFYMAGAFTTLGVCLLFLVPWFLPQAIVDEWIAREKSYRIHIPSSNSSEATKSWTLDSGSSPFESENVSLFYETKKELGIALDKDALKTNLANKRSEELGLVYIVEKTFSIPKLASQQESVFGGMFYDCSSDVWIRLSDPTRETWV